MVGFGIYLEAGSRGLADGLVAHGDCRKVRKTLLFLSEQLHRVAFS